jgi:cell pole-organizing protein PopZ
MSGTTPPKPPGGDPAMDDILASIRRILNEEDGQPGGPAAPGPAPGAAGAPAPALGAADAPLAAAPAAAGAMPLPEPIELTEAMLVTPTPTPPTEARPAAAEAPATVPTLLAPAAAATTAAAVGQLLKTVAQERAALVSRGGPSIEDVVREEIRPLLKEWLDTHLPPLVERLVRAEIERVVSRGMS